MADIKWSAFSSSGDLATGDVLVGLRAGANIQTGALTIPWDVALGGTGLSSTVANELLFSSSADTVSGLATANNGLLSTNGSGVPAINNTVDLVGQFNVDNLRFDGNTVSSTSGALILDSASSTNPELRVPTSGSAFRVINEAAAGRTTTQFYRNTTEKMFTLTSGLTSSGAIEGDDTFLTAAIAGGNIHLETTDGIALSTSGADVVVGGSLTAATYTSTADLQLTPNAGNELDVNFSGSDIAGVQIRNSSATANPRLLFYRGSTTFLSGLYAGQNDSLSGSGDGVYLRNGVAGGKIFLRDSTGNALTVSGGNTELGGSLTTGNLLLDGNTISSTDTNGDINVTPNGTGGTVSTKTIASKRFIPDSNVQSLSATKTLVATDEQYQFLAPNGADRTVALPAAATGMLFIVKNTGSSGNVLNVQDASAAAVGNPISNGIVAGYMYNGTAWESV